MEIKLDGKYVRLGENVEDGDICTIRSSGETSKIPARNGEPEKEVYNFLIELVDGSQKFTTFNKTSLKALIKAFGKESKKWVGKQIMANSVKMTIKGELKNILVWSVPEEESVQEEEDAGPIEGLE